MKHSRRHSQLLARVNFPLYTVQNLSERHILVAGGGGGARTGIPNVIEIYELVNNGKTCRAECISHYETGTEAIMNCTVFNAGNYSLLFAGMEGNCRVFKIKPDLEDINAEDSDSSGISSVRNRNVSSNNNTEPTENISDFLSRSSHRKVIFNIQQLETFQTDFSDEPFQKLVRFSPSEMLLVTGGTDGHIRVWKHPNMNQTFDIEAHTDDVDDLDICPLGKMVVTVSRDGHGKVWSLEDGSLITELSYNLPSKAPTHERYIFRGCRFGVIEDTSNMALYCALNPAVRKKPPLKSYLCKWDTKKFSFEKIVSTGNEMSSAMAISDNGRFLALGTQSGSIKVFIAFSLQCINNFDQVHGIFVTCLQFLPTAEVSRRICGDHEVSLVSVSVDNHIIVHHVPTRGTLAFTTLMTLFILTLFLTFVLMDYLNL